MSRKPAGGCGPCVSHAPSPEAAPVTRRDKSDCRGAYLRKYGMIMADPGACAVKGGQHHCGGRGSCNSEAGFKLMELAMVAGTPIHSVFGPRPR